MGSEDPGVWPAIAAFRKGSVPDLRRIDQISNADVEGSGEILRITATPQGGARTVRFDRQELITYDIPIDPATGVASTTLTTKVRGVQNNLIVAQDLSATPPQ